MIDIKAEEGACEEASPMSHNFYIPCNRPASRRIFHAKDNREYRMCDMCADHNLRRGGEDRGEYRRKEGR